MVERLYSAHIREYFADVDLILGCGDLHYEYLEFLISTMNIPLLYVPGNHDPEYDERNPLARADGCEFLDRRVLRIKGLNVAGIGGSIQYHPAAINQYTQTEMYFRILSFLPALLGHGLRHGRVDILMAHSPPLGIHDDDDPAHHGFSAFVGLFHTLRPRYFLHGHTMVYKSNLVPPVTQVGNTTVINVYPYRLIEIEPHAG